MKRTRQAIILLLTFMLMIIPATTTMAGQWEQNNGKWKYKQDDGSYLRKGWQLIDGSWYYFQFENALQDRVIYGAVQSPIVPYDYYVGPDCKMLKGGFFDLTENEYGAGKRIFVDSEGKSVGKYFMVDNILYYGLDSNVNKISTNYSPIKFLGENYDIKLNPWIGSNGAVYENEELEPVSKQTMDKIFLYNSGTIQKYDSKGNYLGSITEGE